MAEYIDRQAAIEKIRYQGIYGSGFSDEEREDDVVDMIESIPAADVRPVRRGKWTSVFDIGTVCNQCGYDIEEHGFDVRTDGEPNYCPNCGADMREES